MGGINCPRKATRHSRRFKKMELKKLAKEKTSPRIQYREALNRKQTRQHLYHSY
jgi:hypothetical protein